MFLTCIAWRRTAWLCALGVIALLPMSRLAFAQEKPYFVAYNQQMEEPTNLEISLNPVFGTQRGGNDFLGGWMEFEYGATAWWTTEVYLDGQTTFQDSTLFTGWRWENRFRPLMRNHWVNPVLYVEYENINGADKALTEVVGFDNESDFTEPNSTLRQEHDHEIETKLILSTNARGWNFSENFIAEKNLGAEPWEFGYALGMSRPLELAASARQCRFCPENFTAGLEMYGGLGTAHELTLSGTSHYLAPLIAWQVSDAISLRAGPAFGLTANSHRLLLRFGITYELSGFGRRIASYFGGGHP